MIRGPGKFVGKRGRRLAALGACWIALLAVAHPVSSSAGWKTPKDPPPIPAKKPAVPAVFAAKLQKAKTIQRVAAPKAVPVTAKIQAVKAAPPVSNLPMNGPGLYYVRAGDTLYSISRRFGIPVQDIVSGNRLRKPYVLHIGQRLAIPRQQIYRVRKGDTVYSIALAHNVELASLVGANGIGAPFRISIGQPIVIPGRTTTNAPQNGQARVTSVAAVVPSAPPRLQNTPSQGPVHIPKPPPRQSSKFLWPVNGRIISGYGPREGGLHNDGINILAPRGTPVLAAENGVVVYAGTELSGFGNLILLRHADGWVTAYAHNEHLLVRKGQKVRRGDAIARIGKSGNVARPQLHFEIRKGTRAVNPTKLLTPPATASRG